MIDWLLLLFFIVSFQKNDFVVFYLYIVDYGKCVDMYTLTRVGTHSHTRS